MLTRFLASLGVLIVGSTVPAAEVSFQKLAVTTEFLSEGADMGDFDHDGKMDITAGPYWFSGPDFKQRHEFAPPPAKPYDGEKSYSDYFLAYTYDFNGDGWMDILVYSWPGKEVAWYENPQNRPGHWLRHVLLAEGDGESPTIGDMNGDGKPELLVFTGGQLGFYEVDWKQPDHPAKFWPVTPEDKKKYFRYTHGYGYGDINGDGRADILERDGWWEQPKDYRKDGLWQFHPFSFAPANARGGAHMLVYDVNGDGKNDVITSWDAHGYGLAWYEQLAGTGETTFKEHMLVNTKPEDNPQGVKFTQIHALFAADMNHDGLMDFVTGKRFWAHGPGKDAEPDAPATLYWFELKRNGKQAEFIPHQIDDNSGVGTQITARDVNGDGLPDVISSNKKGVNIFLQNGGKVRK